MSNGNGIRIVNDDVVSNNCTVTDLATGENLGERFPIMGVKYEAGPQGSLCKINLEILGPFEAEAKEVHWRMRHPNWPDADPYVPVRYVVFENGDVMGLSGVNVPALRTEADPLAELGEALRKAVNAMRAAVDPGPVTKDKIDDLYAAIDVAEPLLAAVGR